MIDSAVAGATGFATALSLILAIGAQNAFVLRQGLLRSHVLTVVLICALSDAILIAAGVLGFGAIVEAWPAFPTAMRYLGAAFLFVYGALRFRAAWIGGGALGPGQTAPGYWQTVATCLLLTWANPHVYLDTLGLIGAISTQFPPVTPKLVFGIGAVTASFVFFFSLGYGARLLAPYLKTDRAWAILDTAIGVLMWTLSVWLLSGH